MSSVYAGDRRHTPYDPVDYGADLQDELSKFLADEKYVPKKWRLILGASTLAKADELMDNIIFMNSTPKGSKIRTERTSMAIINCVQLDRMLSRLINTIPTASGGSMKKIIKDLTKVESGLRRALRTVKE